MVLPPRRYEGKCKNNDAPLALASANTTHLVIGAWCTQGALGLQSTRVRLTKRSRSRSERLDRRNVGDWFRVLEKKGRRTSRGAQGLARASLLCGTRCPNTFAQPLRSTRGFVLLSPSLTLTHTLSSPSRDEENLADIFVPNFPKSRRNEQVGRKGRAVVGIAGGPLNGRAVREPRRWDDGHKKVGVGDGVGPRS